MHYGIIFTPVTISLSQIKRKIMAEKHKHQSDSGRDKDTRSTGNNSRQNNVAEQHTGDHRKEGGAQNASQKSGSSQGNTGGSQRSGR